MRKTSYNGFVFVFVFGFWFLFVFFQPKLTNFLGLILNCLWFFKPPMWKRRGILVNNFFAAQQHVRENKKSFETFPKKVENFGNKLRFFFFVFFLADTFSYQNEINAHMLISQQRPKTVNFCRSERPLNSEKKMSRQKNNISASSYQLIDESYTLIFIFNIKIQTMSRKWAPCISFSLKASIFFRSIEEIFVS